MNVYALSLAALIAGFAFVAEARDDIMPPPKSAPRIPVERQVLQALANSGSSEEYEGAAQALDGQRLSINGKEIRLYGILAPALSSSYGDKSRQQLGRMLQGTVLCKATDKDRDGRAIAFCGTVNIPDISYEMLRQGWAMVDRKTLQGNKLSEIYGKVEQEAQASSRGIFAPQPMAAAAFINNPGNGIALPPVAPLENNRESNRAAEQQPASPVVAAPAVAPAAVATAPAPAPVTPVVVEANASVPSVAAAMAEPLPGASQAISNIAQTMADRSPTLVERYQVLIGSFFLLLAAMIYAGIPGMRERARTRETRRSVAAALRGELMAARHIARTKARELLNSKKPEGQSTRPSQLWPRIRTIVYQGNVGSIGLLGSELARRVASVYGQCIDYAAFFQHANVARIPAPKAVSDTLNILADHMDVVLDGLAQVEESGMPFVADATEYPMLAQGVPGEEVEETPAQRGLQALAHTVGSLFGKREEVVYEEQTEEAEADETEGNQEKAA